MMRRRLSRRERDRRDFRRLDKITQDQTITSISAALVDRIISVLPTVLVMIVIMALGMYVLQQFLASTAQQR